MEFQKIKKSNHTVFCNWSDEIEIHVNDALLYQIGKAREVLKHHSYIRSVSLDVPDDFLKPESEVDLYYGCFYDNVFINIHDVFVHFYIQSRYSNAIWAEYDMTHIVPHPLLAELDLEEEGEAYEVQTYTLCDGWVNCWTTENKDGSYSPQRFKSREAAQEEIDEYRQDIAEAIEAGDMQDSNDELRIVAVSD